MTLKNIVQPGIYGWDSLGLGNLRALHKIIIYVCIWLCTWYCHHIFKRGLWPALNCVYKYIFVLYIRRPCLFVSKNNPWIIFKSLIQSPKWKIPRVIFETNFVILAFSIGLTFYDNRDKNVLFLIFHSVQCMVYRLGSTNTIWISQSASKILGKY